MTSLSITPCRVSDVDRIRVVQKATWLATYPNAANGITRKAIITYFQDKARTVNWLAKVKESLANDANSYGWIATIDNTIVGYSFALKMETKNRIMALYVLPAYQGQGIGKKLMHTMLSWFANTNPVTLETASYNAKAIRFYQSFGFVDNGPVHNEAAALSTGIVIPEIEMVKKRDG